MNSLSTIDSLGRFGFYMKHSFTQDYETQVHSLDRTRAINTI